MIGSPHHKEFLSPLPFLSSRLLWNVFLSFRGCLMNLPLLLKNFLEGLGGTSEMLSSKGFKVLDGAFGGVRDEEVVVGEGVVMTSSSLEMLTNSCLGGIMVLNHSFSGISHLEDLHVTWAHLEKKRTRLQTNTKTLEDLCSQSLETASQAIHDAVTTHKVTASQQFKTASARTDSHIDLEDSTYDDVTTINAMGLRRFSSIFSLCYLFRNSFSSTTMGDENPIRTLGDYSKPSHEGYRNTIELPVGNNVLSIGLNAFQQDPSPHGGSYYPIPCSILSTGKDRKTLQRYPNVPTTLRRIFIRSKDSFQGLTLKSPSSWHRSLALSKLRDLNAKESWALLEDLALYDNVSWTDPRDFAKPVKAIALPQDVPINKITTSCEICSGPHNTQYCMKDSERAFVEYASSRTDEARDPQCSSHPSTSINAIKAHFNETIISQTSLQQPVVEIEPQQPEEPRPTLENEFKDLHLNLPVLEVLAHALIYNAILDKYVEILELGKNGSAFVQGEIPGRGFLATANAVIDCRMAKIAVGEGITRIGTKSPYYARKDFLDCYMPGEWEISRNVELNPFKDTLVFRRMVEFLGAILINLKCNMWESEDQIKKLINWDKPPKNRDGERHAWIRIIEPDGEEFTKTLQLIPTTRKLSVRENLREIIDLDHFYDT
ncbi:hypothetical protein Tco_1482768 [Tanacetum coccineum]